MISYCVLHQPKESVDREKYLGGMKNFHRSLDAESAAIQKLWEGYDRELIGRSTETLNGMLQAFLQTPLKSDEQDIRKTIREVLEKTRDQLVPQVRYGLSTSWEGEVATLVTQNALLKRMMKVGKEYLGELGFDVRKSDAPIFESMFIVQGGLNLDILEHIVRDRLGIYNGDHGRHANEFGCLGISTYNHIYSYGKEAMRLLDKDVTEAAIFFAKPHALKYEEFHEGLVEALEKMIVLLKTSYITLWQRKLGLGKGREYVLRLYLHGRDAQLEETNRLLSEAVRWLSTYKVETFVRESIADGGAMLIKQMIR
jgi:hypothetical protein